MNQLVIVGSVNYDLIFTHDRLPTAGETLTGACIVESCGGKGANQAIAAARCARDRNRFPITVSFAGAIGDDTFGERQRRVLEADGVDIENLIVLKESHTGLSSIWVEATSGQNRILNAPGANLLLRADHLAQLPIESARWLLLQNECTAELTRTAAKRAVDAGVPVIWNPAPFSIADEPALAPEAVKLLTPNEVEAAAMLGQRIDIEDPLSAVRALLDRGYERVLLTLGERGVAAGSKKTLFVEPAPRVQAIDTTAAGDALSGALAAALTAGWGWRRAVRFAVAYASASVRRRGAQDSLPYELPAD